MSHVGNGTATVEGRYGPHEFFPLDDPIGQALRRYGEWAQAELDLLRAFVGLGSTVVEIGADIGAHTVAFSRLVGPDGQVVALEPQKEVFALLQRNVARTGLGNVSLHNAAAGRVAGEMKVPRLDNEAHVKAGAAPASGGDTAGEAAQIVPIDSLELAACHLVKLDAAGMGAEILAGMKETIAKRRPVLFVECNAVADGVGLLTAIGWDRYRFFLTATAAFNPDNHAGNLDNIFGLARDASLLCVPEELAALTPATNATARVTEVRDGDELAAAILATPRSGDQTEHDRDSAWLLAQLNEYRQIGAVEAPSGLAEFREILFRQAAELEAERSARRRSTLEVESAQAAVTRAEFRAKSSVQQLEHAERQAALAIAALEKQLAAREEDLAAARQEAAAAHEEAAARDHSIVALEGRVAALRSSTSWRLTKPLRWLRGQAGE